MLTRLESRNPNSRQSQVHRNYKSRNTQESDRIQSSEQTLFGIAKRTETHTKLHSAEYQKGHKYKATEAKASNLEPVKQANRRLKQAQKLQ